MKVFAVYADVEFLSMPEWLDVFRAKYDKPYPYHITLKQPCYIAGDQVAGLKRQLTAFFSSSHSDGHVIDIRFDRVVADEQDGIIMLASSRGNGQLHKMQRSLVSGLQGYRYCEADAEAWEQAFVPHVTIARELHAATMIQAKAEVSRINLPIGSIKTITLVVADGVGADQAAAGDLTHYKL